MANFKKDAWDEIWSNYKNIPKKSPLHQFKNKYIIRTLLRDMGIFNGQERNGMVVSDFGCGTGELLSKIHEKLPDLRLVGLDLSSYSVSIARNKLPKAEIRQCNLLTDSPSHPSLYLGSDFGICSEILEHLDNPPAFFMTVKKYMKPGGKVLFTVPAGPMNHFYESIGHRRHYSAGQLASLLEENGFKVIIRASIGFPFVNIYRLAMLVRGQAFAGDVSDYCLRESLFLNFVSAVFSFLFKFNLNMLPWGWQTVVVAEC